MKKRIANLDDYMDLAMTSADWSALASEVDVDDFHDHFADQDAVAERLKAFDIVVIMRDRRPFPRPFLIACPSSNA